MFISSGRHRNVNIVLLTLTLSRASVRRALSQSFFPYCLRLWPMSFPCAAIMCIRVREAERERVGKSVDVCRSERNVVSPPRRTSYQIGIFPSFQAIQNGIVQLDVSMPSIVDQTCWSIALVYFGKIQKTENDKLLFCAPCVGNRVISRRHFPILSTKIFKFESNSSTAWSDQKKSCVCLNLAVNATVKYVTIFSENEVISASISKNFHG